ncbi:MAG: hypothetical protein KDD69_12710 [Bdellovibrionales bacterium]|nr:hypothetical protein [Bdellovibrionales bacterium]
MGANKRYGLTVGALLVLLAGCSDTSWNPREWEQTEKGAAIGGVGGAALGAAASENRATGALVGGAAGAAAGGLIGRELEQRDEEVEELRRDRARMRDDWDENDGVYRDRDSEYYGREHDDRY